MIKYKFVGQYGGFYHWKAENTEDTITFACPTWWFWRRTSVTPPYHGNHHR